MGRFIFACLTMWALSAVPASAQYCTVAPVTGGLYINYINFLQSGTPYTTVTESYADRSGVVSQNMYRMNGYNIQFNVQNCSGVSKQLYMRYFADWNQDGDFNDADEIAASFTYNVASGACGAVGSSVNIWPPIKALTGNVRLRITASEGSYADPCATGYVGEAEDYTIAVLPNTAPTLNNSGTPFVNSLRESQTSNSGFSVTQLVKSTLPAVNMINDADPGGNPPLGIAIYGTTGSGTWQFKTAAGSWTNFGVLSTANALTIMNNASTMIRFLPSGSGTATISFRAWDRTVSDDGAFYNIIITGGTSAFSAATETATLTVLPVTDFASGTKLFMGANSTGSNSFTSLDPATGKVTQPDIIVANNINAYAMDVALDLVNNKLVWAGTAMADRIARSDFNGNSQEIISTGYNYTTGVAASSTNLFIADQYSSDIYRTSLTGTGKTRITNNAGLYATDWVGDVEYANGSIFFTSTQDYTSFQIVSANTDGTGWVELYSTFNMINGLYADNVNVYWTEYIGPNSLVRMSPISSFSATTLATVPNRYAMDLQADYANGKVYFTDGDINNYNDGYLNMVSTSGGAFSKILSLGEMYPSFVFDQVIPLPVIIADFTAADMGNKVRLDWKTGSEHSSDYFMVERSLNGTDFEAVGKVPAKGFGSEYTFDDNTIASVKKGNVYYRLQQMDKDGTYEYSKIARIVRSGEEFTVTVNSLLQNNAIRGKVNSTNSGSIRFTFRDINGRILATQQNDINVGENNINMNVPGTLQPGIYMLQAEGGDYRETFKMIQP